MSKQKNGFHESFTRKENIRLSSNRTFGLVLSGAFFAVALLPLLHHHPIRTWAFPIALILFVLAVFADSYLNTLNQLWSKLGILMQTAVSPVVLILLFYVGVTPVALIAKIFRKQFLALKYQPEARSYWIERKSDVVLSSMRDQF